MSSYFYRFSSGDIQDVLDFPHLYNTECEITRIEEPVTPQTHGAFGFIKEVFRKKEVPEERMKTIQYAWRVVAKPTMKSVDILFFRSGKRVDKGLFEDMTDEQRKEILSRWGDEYTEIEGYDLSIYAQYDLSDSKAEAIKDAMSVANYLPKDRIPKKVAFSEYSGSRSSHREKAYSHTFTN